MTVYTPMHTTSVVLAWSMFGVFILDAILVTISIIITAVYMKTRKNQPRLETFNRINRTFSISHSIVIAVCTCLVLGLRSVRLILNVHTAKYPLVQQLYCRISAWTWDCLIALLVFAYIARCWNMFVKYSEANKQVKNWNVKLKQRWKQYRLFFKARTQTISTFLTPRSSDSFFRSSTQSLKRALKRKSRNSTANQSDNNNNNSITTQATTTMTTEDVTKEVPRASSRRASMIEMKQLRSLADQQQNIELHDIPHVDDTQENTTTIPPPTTPVSPIIEATQTKASAMRRSMSLPRMDYGLKPLGDNLPFSTSSNSIKVETEETDSISTIINNNNNHRLTIPSLNMKEVLATKVDDEKKNKTVLKSILTRRKLEREQEQDINDGAMTTSRRKSVRLMEEITSTPVNNTTVPEDEEDEETAIDVYTEVDSVHPEINTAYTANTHTNYSFKLNLDSVRKDVDTADHTDLFSLFGDEIDEDDLDSDDLDILEDHLVGSPAKMAIGIQRTMDELLNIPTVPRNDSSRISKRLSAASVKRNHQIAQLQQDIMKGQNTSDPIQQTEQAVIVEIIQRSDSEQPRWNLPSLSFETKLGILVAIATAIVVIIEVVLTGAAPYYYPAGAECNKNLLTTVFTYKDPMLYIYFVGLLICSCIFAALAILVSILKVYDFLVYEIRVIAIGMVLVPLAVILTPIMYAAGASLYYAPIQHYFLNAIVIFWMVLFQSCSIFAPLIYLLRALNTKTTMPTMTLKKNKSMAQVDVNAESKDVQDRYPFDYVLTDKPLRDAFRKFLVKMLCPENMFFLDEVALYQQVDSPSKRRELAADILQRFIRSGSLYELNVSNYDKLSMIEKYQRLNQDCPKNLFKELESSIRFTLATDCYKKFLTSAEFKAVAFGR
jgi:hypothetical protein